MNADNSERGWIGRAGALLAVLILAASASAADLVDMAAIRNVPLDARVLETRTEGGVVIQHVEFTSIDDPDGNPIRTFGILAYPEGGTNLPAVLWCQGGMADAGLYFPKIFADKGYISISINLPKAEWQAGSVFDAGNPRKANYIRLAAVHMRAVTYLAARPETNPNRIGVGGSSYGGMFSTLVAGMDPRIKAGMSFFAGGNHRLGTNLPQFTALANLAAVDAFDRTGDGAAYHRLREVPFLWGVAANDNWFFFPAVTKTYKDARSPDKRMGICPSWTHGFPAAFDNQLVDWFDVFLTGTRKPYNKPGMLRIVKEDGKLVGRWTWSGQNAVKKAELVLSYGRMVPWHGWVHRLHQPVPATIEGLSAHAVIPVPESGLPLLAYGNIVDENNVLVSTLPVTVIPRELGIATPTGRFEANGCPWGDFDGDVEITFQRFGYTFGVLDSEIKQAGDKSLRVPPPQDPARDRPPVALKLHNVYERSHVLSFWARADRLAKLRVDVRSVPPANWSRPAVKAILATMPEAAVLPEKPEFPVFTSEASVTEEWREFTLECPYTGVPVEGYNLSISCPGDADTTFWVDSIRFEPRWEIGE